MDNMDKDLQRFNSFCKKVGDCELWQGYLDKDGYGTFYFKKKSRRAHRVAYFFKFGPIKDGYVIDHICKKRNCVAIEHLRMVTQEQNSLDNSMSVGAINSRKQNCKYGHPLDRKYGKQRYCSICLAEKSKRLAKKWREEANLIKC